MKTVLSCISLFLISVSLALAQKDFRAGYIITTQNDTIVGEIDYRSNSSNHQLCRFKKDNNTIEYSPNHLLGYGYKNDKYLSSGVVEGSFVEVVVNGELSLFKHAFAFYVRKSGGELYKLESKEIRSEVNGKVGVRKDTRWKGLISYLVSDCINDQNAIKSLKLDERNLTDIVIRYNECKGKGFTVYKESKPWQKVEVGLTLGLTKSVIDVSSSNQIPYLSDRYSSLNPFIGVMFAISSPRITERFAFQPEIQITKSNYSSFIELNNWSGKEYYDTYIDLTTVSIPLSLRYSFPEKKYSVRLLAGVNYDNHFKADTKVIHEVVSDGVVITTENKAFTINQNQIGYLGGLCVVRSFGKFKANLGLRYCRMANFNSTKGLTANIDKLSAYLMLQLK